MFLISSLSPILFYNNSNHKIYYIDILYRLNLINDETKCPNYPCPSNTPKSL